MNQLQNKPGILVKVFQCMYNTFHVMELPVLPFPGNTFSHISGNNLMEKICQRILFAFIIMIKSHPGHACLFYDIRNLYCTVRLFVHKGKHGLTYAHSGKSCPFIIIL